MTIVHNESCWLQFSSPKIIAELFYTEPVETESRTFSLLPLPWNMTLSGAEKLFEEFLHLHSDLLPIHFITFSSLVNPEANERRGCLIDVALMSRIFRLEDLSLFSTSLVNFQPVAGLLSGMKDQDHT